MQPPYPSVPSRFGQVNPPSTETFAVFRRKSFSARSYAVVACAVFKHLSLLCFTVTGICDIMLLIRAAAAGQAEPQRKAVFGQLLFLIIQKFKEIRRG